MRKAVICFLCCVSLALFASGCAKGKAPADLDGLFRSAGDSYKKGNYSAAIADYEKILKSGYESAHVYYNIGNCYFKENKLGKTIVNYRRALRLDPRDGDLRSNYKFAYSMVKRNVFPPQRIFLFRLLKLVGTKLTLNEATLILCVTFLLFLGNALLYVAYIPTRRFFVFLTAALLLVMAGSAYFVHYKVNLLGKEAVVITDNTYARFEPVAKATTHFTLYEGEGVRVLKRSDSWCKIKRTDGNIGWVPDGSIEIV